MSEYDPRLDPESLLDQHGAAAFLGVTKRFLEKHRRLGDGPRYVRVGAGRVRYRRKDLISYVADLEQQTPAIESKHLSDCGFARARG